MRSAERYFKGVKRLIDADGAAYWCTEKDFTQAINEARTDIANKCIQVFKEKSFNGCTDEDILESMTNILDQIK